MLIKNLPWVFTLLVCVSIMSCGDDESPELIDENPLSGNYFKLGDQVWEIETAQRGPKPLYNPSDVEMVDFSFTMPFTGDPFGTWSAILLYMRPIDPFEGEDAGYTFDIPTGTFSLNSIYDYPFSPGYYSFNIFSLNSPSGDGATSATIKVSRSGDIYTFDVLGEDVDGTEMEIYYQGEL